MFADFLLKKSVKSNGWSRRWFVLKMRRQERLVTIGQVFKLFT